ADRPRQYGRLLPAGDRRGHDRLGHRVRGADLPAARGRSVRGTVDDVHRSDGHHRTGAGGSDRGRHRLPAAEHRGGHGHAVDRTGDRHMSAPDHSTRTAGRAAGPAAPRQAPPARPSPLLLGAAAVTVAVLALIAVLAAAAAGSNVVLRDAGLIARRGAPVSALIADLAVAVALGGSVLAGWLLREPGDRTRAMTLVAIAAAVTTLARGASLAFSYAVATGQAVGSERFGSDLNVFLCTDLGIWLVLALVVSATATTIAVT